jgi:GNAT superfamily N-acetyltransferase
LTYLIRLAEPTDIPLLPNVELRAVQLFWGFLKETGLTKTTLENVSSLDEFEDARRNGLLWVATTSSGEVVGLAQVVLLDGLAHLDELDVVPEHGRKGAGSRLVQAVCDWAREAGYPKVTLSTFRDVPWNRPFYESRGFQVVEPAALGLQHLALVAAERARDLRTDLRVMMERDLDL